MRTHGINFLPGLSAAKRTALDSFDAVTVPPGKYFMLGDSRDDSFDSCFWGFAERPMVGKAHRVPLS